MTRQEADRIDTLYREIIDWRREDSDRLLAFKGEVVAAIHEAVDAHRLNCAREHLEPMAAKLDWLYDNAQRRCTEARQRARMQRLFVAAVGAVAALLGALAPYLLRLF